MTTTSAQIPVVGLVGPTASGKSTLAIQVAKLIAAQGGAAEIVNADSMLVYREMDIGTAKPTRAEREEVPHHLIDIMDVSEPASAALFQRLARDTIASLRDRGVIALVVGGSSLYVRAIFDHFEFPKTDPVVRQRWLDELARLGPEALHQELTRLNPDAGEAILPGNGRRIVRALEVIELTGSFSPHLPAPEYALEEVLQFGLQLDRDEMDRRICLRVENMWRDGLVDEVRALVANGRTLGPTASRALGYQQILAYFDGELDEAEAKQSTIDGTRRFARKQLGWFRRDPRITWLDAFDPNAAQHIATRCLS